MKPEAVQNDAKEILKKIPNRAGIYFLYDSNKNIVYTGISVNLQRDILDRRRERKINFVSITYSCAVSTYEERLIKAKMIHNSV